MILGILSDTHGDTDAVKRVYAALPNADAWAFLGDGQREANLLKEMSGKPVYTVKGNCDAGDIAEEQVITLGGVQIVCPGSPSVPRRGRRKSFAKLEIENGSAMASIVAL